MSDPLRLRILPIAIAVLTAMAIALGAGCGRNSATTVLTPTGLRPAPAAYPGSILGSLQFDPARTPRMANPPYPPTRLELRLGQAIAKVDSASADSRDFVIDDLPPGTYTLVVSSSLYGTVTRTSLPVHDGPVEIGEITLPLVQAAVDTTLHVMGTMPGYDVDGPITGVTYMDTDGSGLWHNPSDLSPPTVIAAGTYRLKFVSDINNTTNTYRIGWGGSPTDTLQVPVADHLAAFGSGPSSDLVVHFPTTGYYAFDFDQPRQRFSISFISPVPPSRLRRIR